jgi:hypothetical protein
VGKGVVLSHLWGISLIPFPGKLFTLENFNSSFDSANLNFSQRILRHFYFIFLNLDFTCIARDCWGFWLSCPEVFGGNPQEWAFWFRHYLRNEGSNESQGYILQGKVLKVYRSGKSQAWGPISGRGDYLILTPASLLSSIKFVMIPTSFWAFRLLGIGAWTSNPRWLSTSFNSLLQLSSPQILRFVGSHGGIPVSTREAHYTF